MVFLKNAWILREPDTEMSISHFPDIVMLLNNSLFLHSLIAVVYMFFQVSWQSSSPHFSAPLGEKNDENEMRGQYLQRNREKDSRWKQKKKH